MKSESEKYKMWCGGMSEVGVVRPDSYRKSASTCVEGKNRSVKGGGMVVVRDSFFNDGLNVYPA
jgi:hypothetical protein